MDNNSNKIIYIFLAIAVTMFLIVGGTLAYWSWQSAAAQNTAISFTLTSGLSCSADGGGNITSSDVKLAPAKCTDTEHAIQRTITTSVTNSNEGSAYMSLSLKVNSMASELAASQNFKYALTTNPTSCTTDVKETGTFTGAIANSSFTILDGDEYPTSPGTGTYYLYIWLDEAESNNNTQNKTFNLSLTGTCSNNRPRITSTVYSVSTHEFVTGETIPRGTTTYSNYQDAINAFGYNVFLKHIVEEDRSIETNWCWVLKLFDTFNDNETECTDNDYGSYFKTESECISSIEQYMLDAGYQDNGNLYESSSYVCAKSSNQVVVSSEIGFVKDGNVYYLHDWDDEESHDENDTTLASVFGSNNCNDSGECQTGAWSTLLGDFYDHHIGVEYSLSGNHGTCTLDSYDGVQNSSCYSAPINTDGN